MRNEGFIGIYTGYMYMHAQQVPVLILESIQIDPLIYVCVFVSLSAGLLRQATYSTTRLGVYQTLMDKFTR